MFFQSNYEGETSITQIASEGRINAPKEKICTIIADLGGVQEFYPDGALKIEEFNEVSHT
ncbi:MAG: hypothetical protein O7D34_06575 [Ignavibacteria bacterium]|nr:hypothetical protein [Ignavibacteria bacterium]